MGARAIAVILSGHGTDGAEVCKAIQANGGMAIVQDKSAEIDDMRMSAQASGAVDCILLPERMWDVLKHVAHRFKRTEAAT